MSNCGVVWLFLCVHSIASTGCRAWDSRSQGLTFSCATLPLLPWAKSILGRIGETAEIASVIYLTSFAQNCLFNIPCTLSPASAEARRLGTHLLCSWQCLEKWDSQQVPGFAAANPLVLLGQHYCSTGRAPSLVGPAEQGKGLWWVLWSGSWQ